MKQKKSTIGNRHFLAGLQLRKGLFAAPKVVSFEAKKFVFKTFGRGKNLSLQQAKDLIEQVKEYRQQLVEAGVFVPEIRMIRPVQEVENGRNTGNRLICSLEGFVGKGRDVYHLIEGGRKSSAVNAYSNALAALHQITAAGSRRNAFRSEVMVDSIPRNFVLDSKGRVFYVDLFTPKLRDSKGRLVPYYGEWHGWSRKMLEFKFGDKRGIFGSFLVCAIAARPALRAEFERAMFEFLRKSGELRLLEYLQKESRSDYQEMDFLRKNFLDKIHSKKKR